MGTKLKLVCFVTAVLSASSAWSAITYVDAAANTTGDDGNTTVNGALVSGANTGGNSGTDNLWRNRLLAGTAAGNVWESDTTAAAGETTEPLITTIVLGPGTYNLYGIFRDAPGDASYWDAAFSLDGSAYSTFDYRNALLALGDGGNFANPGDLGDILLASGNIYIASLGQVVLPSSTSVPFYIQGPEQDLSGTPQAYTDNTGQRTWYEGVGYEIVPEPSSALLLIGFGLIGLGFAWRRRQWTGSLRCEDAKS